MGLQDLLDRFARREFLEDEVHGDAGPGDDGR